MADEAKLKELQKNRRLSLQHLRRGALIFGVTAVTLIVVQQFVSIQLWIPFIILGILSLTVIGDAINYFYCGRQIRKMQHDNAALEKPGV
jgi:intracellular septation protein A